MRCPSSDFEPAIHIYIPHEKPAPWYRVPNSQKLQRERDVEMGLESEVERLIVSKQSLGR